MMTNIQTYIDAFFFLIENTHVLSRLSITLAISIVMGALILDRFKVRLWIIPMIVFLILTQWQLDAIMRELGYTQIQITQPHVLTLISAVLFVIGSGTGYLIKKKFYLAYTKDTAEHVAENIITEINGGVIEKSTLSKTT